MISFAQRGIGHREVAMQSHGVMELAHSAGGKFIPIASLPFLATHARPGSGDLPIPTPPPRPDLLRVESSVTQSPILPTLQPSASDPSQPEAEPSLSHARQLWLPR